MVRTKEEIKQYQKEYRENNKEKQKEYREENREKNKEYCENYYQHNKDKYKQYVKNNPESKKKSDKKYGQSEKGIKVKRISKWRQRDIKTIDWDFVYDKYINTKYCEVCDIELTDGKPNTHSTRNLDHQHASGEIRNIVCRRCNIQRKSIDLKHMYVLQELHRYFNRTET